MFQFGRAGSRIERLAPRARATHSREALEREAEAEIQARIDLGRPGPEEAERTRPYPDWLLLRRPPMRPMDLVEVDLNALAPPPAPTSTPPRRRPAPPEEAESARRSGAGWGA